MINIKEYPQTKRKNGIGNLVALLVSFPQSVLTYCMHSQAVAYSGIMCMHAIAIKTPPLKAFAIPNIMGLSWKALLLTGTIPRSAASRKATAINMTLRVSGLHIIFYRLLLKFNY
jgi:hypothetical protein